MRRLAGGSSRIASTRWNLLLILSAALCIAPHSMAAAQSAPETLRVNLDPPKPGIRSVLIDKKYRPIISRDDDGVVIDTIGSANETPPCTVELEITLENSRVLHRTAAICSGNTIVVDVDNENKPGQARVVGGTGGAVAAPDAAGAQATQQSTQATNTESTTPAARTQKPLETLPSESGVLKPLERADSPIDAPSDLPSIVNQSLDRQRRNTDGGTAPAAGDITIQPSEDRIWSAAAGSAPGAQSELYHTVPETDDGDFRAFCQTQSGFGTIVFSQTNSAVSEGVTQSVRITAGDFGNTYSAVGSSTNNQYGQSFPQVTVPMTDPIWEALIRQTELSILVQGMPPYQVSLKGSANPVRLFVATCSEAQRIVGDDGFGVTAEDPSADRSCREAGAVRSLQGVRPGQIVFRNSGSEPVDVHWIDYNGGERPYARLQPGQILEQETYVSHAWLVRGADGQCRGIYVTRSPYREVVLTGSAPLYNPQGPIGLPPTDPFAPSANSGPLPPADVGGGFGQPIQPQAGLVAVADYLCTGGVDLNVRFSPDGTTATVAEMGYGVVTLVRQGGASTFNYVGQGHVLRGQLQNATWTRPGLRDVFCARR